MKAGAGPTDWDAADYDRISDMQLGWGREVLGRLSLRGDEAVLDAGCGSGRVTRLIAERLPRGRVVAVDAAPSMVEHTREAVPEAEVIQSDLIDLEIADPVDVVFSNATLHWISDHDRLFLRLHDCLRPGGRLEAQCGGRGNVATALAALKEVAREEPFAPYLGDWEGPWLFASAEETAERLDRAGFEDVRCWLEEKRVILEDPRRFQRTVGLPVHFARLPEELHEPFVEALIEKHEEPEVQQFVRLNISARRPE